MTVDTKPLADRFIQDVKSIVREQGIAAAATAGVGFLMRQKRSPAALASLQEAADAAAIGALLFASRGGGMVDGAVFSEALSADHSQWWTMTFTNTRPDALAEGDEFYSLAQVQNKCDLQDVEMRDDMGEFGDADRVLAT